MVLISLGISYVS